MSWFTGIVLKQNTLSPKIKDYLTGLGEVIYEGERVFLFGGSPSGKNYFSGGEGAVPAWVVAGMGLKSVSNGVRFLNKKEWQQKMALNEVPVNGHFAIAVIEEENVRLYTDTPGLRDIYITDLPDKIIFTTKLQHIALFTELKPDFVHLGSTWNSINKITDESIYKGVNRLVKGARAVINRRVGKSDIIKEEWIPKFTERKEAADEFTDKLSELINIEDEEMLLGLSGGMDSRVLLSVLLANNKINWSAHSTGRDTDSDSSIPSEMANVLLFPHKKFSDEFESGPDDIPKMEEFSFLTGINHPVSSYFSLKITDVLQKENKVLIDGGFGEIYRREYFNRILWKGRFGLANRRSDVIAQAISYERGDVFIKEISELLRDGVDYEISALMLKLPDPVDIGLENWVDLFALKTRLINYYAPEQSRLDGKVINYMPFVQSSLLEKLFEIPLSLRKNGKLFRQIIKKKAPVLTEFPLAKGGRLYPFSTGTLQARLLTRFLKKNGAEKKGPLSLPFMKEYVMDRIQSGDVINDSFYDYKKIAIMAERFYNKGERGEGIALEWWLSFEMSMEYLRKLNKSRGER